MAHCVASLFADMPVDHVREAIGTPDPVISMRTPWNRRIRRRLETSSGVLIHLCSGSQKWTPKPHSRYEVLEIDLDQGKDLMDHGVWSYLLLLARKGLVRGIIGGPPCATVSRLRNTVDGGPRPVRGRGDGTRYGLPDLSEPEAQAVRISNMIWIRMIALFLLAEATLGDVMFGAEGPEDVENPNNEAQPSVWEWPFIAVLVEMFGFRLASFDQIVFGHPTKKPTTVLTNSWHLYLALHENRASPKDPVEFTFKGLSLQQRVAASKALACWAPGLADHIARAWYHWVKTPKRERDNQAAEQALQIQHLSEGRFTPWHEVRRMVRGSLDDVILEECLRLGRRPCKFSNRVGRLRALKLTKEEAQYRRHVLAGHLPYRRDCAICLKGDSKARARRARQATADSFSLSLDVAGPFKPAAQEDEAILGKVRRFLLGVYRFPTTEDGELFWEVPPDMKIPTGSQPANVTSEEALKNPNDQAPFCEDPDLLSLVDPGEVREFQGVEGTVPADFHAVGGMPADEPCDPWNLYPGELLESEGLPGIEPEEESQDFGFFEDVEVADAEAEMAEAEALKEAESETLRWRALYKARVDGVNMRSLVFVELLRSKSQKEVLQATQRIISRLRLYQCPLTLVHSDRGGEFLGKSFRMFLQSLGIKQSTTEADSPASNGRVEAWIFQIKCAIRKRLLESGLPAHFWGLAAVHAVETAHRKQLQDVGIPVKPLIPFNTQCHVQERTWNTNSRGGGVWSSRVVVGRILAPSVHVSRGYVILVVEEDGHERLLVSTSVNIGCREETGLNLQVQGLAIPYVPPAPKRRMREKTTPTNITAAAEENQPQDVKDLQDAELLLQDLAGEGSGSVAQLLECSEGEPSSPLEALGALDLHRLDRLHMPCSLRMLSHQTPLGPRTDPLHPVSVCNHNCSRVNDRGRLSVEQSEAVAASMLSQETLNRFEVGALLLSTFQTSASTRNVDKQAQQRGAWFKTLGAYVHGGVSGVTSESKVRPQLVQLCNRLMHQHVQAPHTPYPFWTALRVSCNAEMDEHVDCHNCPESLSHVVPLSVFQGGRVVVEGVPREFGNPPLVSITPRVMHSVEPSTGTRLVMIAYMPRNTERMSFRDRMLLHALGFALPPRLGHFGLVNGQEGNAAKVEAAGPKINSYSCTLAIAPEGENKCFHLAAVIPLADLMTTQLATDVQWSLTCVMDPAWSSLSEDASTMQEQLYVHRTTLRDAVQALLPKQRGLGGSQWGGKKKPDGLGQQEIGDSQSGTSSETPRLLAVGSCRAALNSLGLESEEMNSWVDHLELEAARLETLLGYQGLGSGPRLRVQRLRTIIGEVNQSVKSWLDVVTASLCLARLQGEEEEEHNQSSQNEIMLQPRTLSMAEVYEDLSSWIPPMADELQALTVTHEAIRIITTQDVDRMVQDGFLVETIPSKLVPVLKPPDARKRARIVGCGNYVELRDRSQDQASSLSSPVTDRAYDRRALYAAGLDMDALRIQLRFSAGQPNWTALMTDVNTAVLLAPARSRGDSRKRIVLIPPKAVVKAGLVSESDRFLIIKAVYGLAESPSDWSVFRDSTMKAFEWRARTGGFRRLRQLVAEPSLWFIVEGQSNSEMQEVPILALLGVYVDDILLTGIREELDDFYQALAGLWKLANPSWLEDGLKFCGIQIELGQDGSWLLHQDDYLLELLRCYGVGHASGELPTFREGYEEPENYSVATLRKAQKIIGELLWLSGRTRMDICYHVCKMGQLLSKYPHQVYEDALCVLQHLARTSALRLRYGGFQEAWTGDQVLRYQRDQNVVESWSDASFGQADGRSHSGVALVLAGGLVSWHSSRQSLVCLSTAESEMVAAFESMTLGRALSPIWIELTRMEPR